MIENITITGKMAGMNETDKRDRPVDLQPSLDIGWIIIKPPEKAPFKVRIQDLLNATEAIKETQEVIE